MYENNLHPFYIEVCEAEKPFALLGDFNINARTPEEALEIAKARLTTHPSPTGAREVGVAVWPCGPGGMLAKYVKEPLAVDFCMWGAPNRTMEVL